MTSNDGGNGEMGEMFFVFFLLLSFLPFFFNLKGSAAAADPLVGQVPLVVNMTLRDKILEVKTRVSGGFQGLGPVRKDSP